MIPFQRGEDFICKVEFHNEKDETIGIPDYDFRLEYYTCAMDVHTATKISGVYTNCHVGADGNLYVTFVAPDFCAGRLTRKATYFIPNDEMPNCILTRIEVEVIGKVE